MASRKMSAKGRVHCNDVCLRLLVSRVRCLDRGAIVVVDTRGVVGHVGYLGQEGREGIGVRFRGEKSINIARSCTEEQVHCRGGRQSLCLGTAA